MNTGPTLEERIAAEWFNRYYDLVWDDGLSSEVGPLAGQSIVKAKVCVDGASLNCLRLNDEACINILVDLIRDMWTADHDEHVTWCEEAWKRAYPRDTGWAETLDSLEALRSQE